jgi:hypothetical protein
MLRHLQPVKTDERIGCVLRGLDDRSIVLPRSVLTGDDTLGTLARTLYYQDRSVGSSQLSFRFQPGAAATQRPASETKCAYYGLYGELSVV